MEFSTWVEPNYPSKLGQKTRTVPIFVPKAKLGYQTVCNISPKGKPRKLFCSILREVRWGPKIA